MHYPFMRNYKKKRKKFQKLYFKNYIRIVKKNKINNNLINKNLFLKIGVYHNKYRQKINLKIQMD
jgi:hypothetical protein